MPLSSLSKLCAALALAVALVLPGPAAADPAGEVPPPLTAPLLRDHPLAGRIWQPGAGRFTTPAAVAAAALAADFVLLGETHDNPDSHALQAWVLRRLIAAGRHPGVAFEMIGTDQAAALASHLSAHPGDADGLGGALGWSERGWPDWQMYRPIAGAALSARLPLAAAGLPRSEVRAVAEGHPPADLAGDLAKQLDPADNTAMRAEIADAHCGMLPESALAGMVQVQRARDARMARALAALAAAQGGAVLIAGSGHARTDRGVPAWLRQLAPGRTALSVAFVEVEDGRTDATGYGEAFSADRLPFDYVWFTARAGRPDPCETFKAQMKRKGG